jgi:hypothetical protein
MTVCLCRSIDVLADQHGDWQMGTVVCKMLSNFSEDMTSSSSTFGYQGAQRLVEVLDEYLGKEA